MHGSVGGKGKRRAKRKIKRSRVSQARDVEAAPAASPATHINALVLSGKSALVVDMVVEDNNANHDPLAEENGLRVAELGSNVRLSRAGKRDSGVVSKERLFSA